MLLKTVDTPIGKLTVYADDTAVKRISFSDDGGEDCSAILDEAVKQLNEYFCGKRKVFTVSIAPDGTPFQKAVWKELMKIPYGETASYKDIAVCIGNEKACRAVGMANNSNPIPVIIPCHRVVGLNGKLTGYAGGLDVKKTLLETEQRYKGDK